MLSFLITLVMPFSILGNLSNNSVPSEAKQAIQAAYNRADMFFERKNVSGVFKDYTSDCKLITLSGRVINLDAMQQSVAMSIFNARSIQASSRVTSILVRKNTAQVTVEEHINITSSNKRTGRDDVYNDDEVDLNTWTKINKKWLQKKITIIKIHQTLNGVTSVEK